MGVSSLQYHTAIVSGFVALKMLNIETYLRMEIASVYRMWKYHENVLIPRIGALRRVELWRI
jgi:hypothetical protein